MVEIQHRRSSLKSIWGVHKGNLFVNVRIGAGGTEIFRRLLQEQMVGVISFPIHSLESCNGTLAEPAQTLSTYLASTKCPALVFSWGSVPSNQLHLAGMSQIPPALMYPASTPGKDWHHFIVTPALERGEDNRRDKYSCSPSSELGEDIWYDHGSHPPVKASQGTTQG